MDLTHKNLCALAVKWLQRPASRRGHGCEVAVSEVASGWSGEIPDAIGFRLGDEQPDVGTVVVEVKVSRADFLRDKTKPHRSGEVEALGNWRYYMCPEGLISPDELPENWGLLYVNTRGHIKPVVSPFLVGNIYDQIDQLKATRQPSNQTREIFILGKLLRRVGDVETYNQRLRDAERERHRLAVLADENRQTIMQQRREISRLNYHLNHPEEVDA